MEYKLWLWVKGLIARLPQRPRSDYALLARVSRNGFAKKRVHWGAAGPYIVDETDAHHLLLGGGKLCPESQSTFTRYIAITDRLKNWSDATGALDRSMQAEAQPTVTRSVDYSHIHSIPAVSILTGTAVPPAPISPHQQQILNQQKLINQQLSSQYGPQAAIDQLKKESAAEFEEHRLREYQERYFQESKKNKP